VKMLHPNERDKQAPGRIVERKTIPQGMERIRQLQELAFRKLRHPNRTNKLEIHMTG